MHIWLWRSTGLGQLHGWPCVDLGFGVLKVGFERECPVECDFEVHGMGGFGGFMAIP